MNIGTIIEALTSIALLLAPVVYAAEVYLDKLRDEEIFGRPAV